MIDKYYIGVDLGTSGVKLLLLNSKGKIIKIVTRSYPIIFPQHGWSEQHPEDWWKETKNGIKELMNEIDGGQVDGISFGGQMHGLVILDEADHVLRPAILWNDGRTEKETHYLNDVIGKDYVTKHTANIAFAGFTAPKILWVKNKEPEVFAKINKIMLPKDYLAYCFSGVFCTDYSDASGTLLLNVEKKNWSKEMLDICGISEEQVPKLYESFDVVGKIRDEIAIELGINKEAKIIAGAGDNAAAAIGTGTVGDGQCNISIGTSGTLFISGTKFAMDDNNALHSFAHADGKYHLLACMLSAASCNTWWMENILHTKDFMKEQEDITKLGDNDVYFMPYLMGERSPYNDPFVRGSFFGLSMDTTRTEMSQAVYEGVAFGLRDSLEVARNLGYQIDTSKICGGGAKSSLWREIIANVMNIKLEILENEEGPALGAAILAAVGCGTYKTVEEAVKEFVVVKETILPRKSIVEKYEKKYRNFHTIYPMLKNFSEKNC